MKKIILILIFTLFLPGTRQADTWPMVREFNLEVGFDYKAERFDLKIPIYDYNGIPRYWLICRGGSDAYLDTLYDLIDVNYVGPLSCRLDIEDRESGLSLLGEDDTPFWHTRGQFHSSQLVGKCGEYPEFGKLRHFRLRGFELTFEVTDFVMKNSRPSYFNLSISLRNDETAPTEQAEQTQYLNPQRQGGSCEFIEKRE